MIVATPVIFGINRLLESFFPPRYVDIAKMPLVNSDDIGGLLHDDEPVPLTWRTAYTLEQLRNGAINNKIVLNSICDFEIEAIAAASDWATYISDERQFMNIKEKAPKKIWYSSEPSARPDRKIKVEEGKVYRVRIFVHNNNPYGEKMTAVDTTAWISISSDVAKEVTMTAYLSSSTAADGYGGGDGIYNNIVLVSADGRKFNVAYVPGSVEYYNNWTKDHPDFAPDGYASLSDYIFASSGVRLGYDGYNNAMRGCDGNLPGGYQYSGWLFFDVIPQFEN
jgi:hypothetical protein